MGKNKISTPNYSTCKKCTPKKYTKNSSTVEKLYKKKTKTTPV